MQVVGQVTNVIKAQNKVDLKLAPDNRVVRCVNNFKLKLVEEDFIQCKLVTFPNGDIGMDQNSYPLVFVSRLDGAFKNCMFGQHWSKAKSLREKLAPNYPKALEVDVMAVEFKRTGRVPETSEDVKEYDLTLLLKEWYKKVVMRQLVLWGFDVKGDEVRESQIPANEIIALCQKNPFLIMGINYEKAKFIANLHNIKFTKEEEAANSVYRRLVYYLQRDKQTCVSIETLSKDCRDLALGLEKLLSKEWGVVEVNDMFYLPEVYKAESVVINEICKRLKKADKQALEKATTIEEKAVLAGVCVITGEAGTGKTTKTGKINKLIRDMKKVPQLVAPTGKAVDRAKKDVGPSASTLHMMMAADKGSKFDWLLVDESSMVTIPLMKEYLTTFPGDYPLIFIGDDGQIPAIQWGGIFKALIESKAVPVFELTHNYRLKKQDLVNNTLFHNISKIRRGETDLKESDSFHKIPGDINGVLKFAKMCHELGCTPREFVIISPYNKDVDFINKYVQHMYHPDSKLGKVDSAGNIWFIGDPVICKKNNRTHNIYNGSMGTVMEIKEDKLWVDFVVHGSDQKHIVPFNLAYRVNDSSDTSYDLTNAKDVDTSILKLAHSITMDSSQGSEWDFVAIYMRHDDESTFVTRERVYTAASRAALYLAVIGSIDAFDTAIKRTEPAPPQNFSKRLADAVKQMS